MIASLITSLLAATLVEGIVLDAATGAPVAGALVQQEGTVATTLTGPDGRFRLGLENGGTGRIAVTDVAHERLAISVAGGAAVTLRLLPLATYVPPPLGPTVVSVPLPPLRAGLELDYRLRQQSLAVGTSAIAGLANNDLRLGLRARNGPWLWEIEGAHVQTPVNIPGLAVSANPAMSPSTWQAGGLAGYIWYPAAAFEAALGTAYRFSVTSPNNGGVPYTASALDDEQTRHALGPTLLVGTQLGRLRLESRLGWYPLVWAWAKAPGTAYGNEGALDARLTAFWRLMPGLAIGAGIGYESWHGGGSESAQLFGLKLHYAPESPERDEQ